MFRGASSAVNLEAVCRLTKAGWNGARSALPRLGSSACWWLAPARCVLCGGVGAAPRLDLCSHCLALLPLHELRHEVQYGGFDLLLHPWHYGYPVDAMLRDLKFDGALAYGRVLGILLGQQRVALAQQRGAPGQQRSVPGMPYSGVVIPMPLHPARHAARGFNQAHELATAAAQVVGAQLGTDLLIRMRNTRPQSSLDRVSRRDNMENAFVCPRPLPAAKIALVDDVMTTGATAAAVAAALRAAGARTVELWVVARVVREA